jgi:oligoribonuclease NrnB/cAMP/cGMP phosphodiesterase (DHH superfamily)
MDGSACSIVFQKFGGSPADVKYVTAGSVERFLKKDPVIQSDKFLIFADVGFAEGEYVNDLEKRGNCVVLDHHKTSVHMKNRSWAYVDDVQECGEKCGCMLLFQYLDKNKFWPDHLSNIEKSALEELCKIVDDHDRWQRKDDRSVDLATLATFMGQDKFISRFFNLPLNFQEQYQDLLGILRDRRDENIDYAIKGVSVRRVAWGLGNEVNVGYITRPEQNTSLMLNTLLIRRPDVEVAAYVDFSKSMVSLRSLGYDVSEMAKYFGGGGHKQASAHPLPKKLKDMLIDEIHGG